MNQVSTVSITAHSAASGIFSVSGGLGGCYSLATQLIPVLTAMPTANASLSSFMAKVTQTATLTNPCELPVVTGSMADEYTSYIKSLESWARKHKTDLSSLLAACSNVPEISSALDSYPNVTSMCDDYTWAPKSTTKKHSSKKTNSKTTTTDGTGTETSASETTTQNSSPSATQADKASGTSDEGSSTAQTIGVSAASRQASMTLAVVGMAGLAIAAMY